ncbi:MAG: ATP-binding protein [Candidatus Saccharimonadales bacterium]
MYIQRLEYKNVRKILQSGLVAIVYGARQVGKTTLANEIAKEYERPLYLTCDNPDVVESLRHKSATELKAYVGDADLVIIDEGQRVENIGLSIKLLHDTYPKINLLVTGSSSLDLANSVAEPLTGRSGEVILYPLSVLEVSKSTNEITPNARVMMDRGGYPAMWSLSAESAHKRLDSLANNYVFRDAFAPQVQYDQTIIAKLLQLLAYQIGNEVSYNELATTLGISKDTVMRYVDLLEKAFIIVRQNQYRRNQRVEIGRLRKVYFIDLGIRYAIINNFNPLTTRDDIGALWENFCTIERLKYLQSTERRVRSYYWRNDDQREIDLVEEESGVLRAYEMKYSSKKLPKLPVGFMRQYPNHQSYKIVNQDTLHETLLSD